MFRTTFFYLSIISACLINVIILNGCATPILNDHVPDFKPNNIDKASIVTLSSRATEFKLLSINTNPAFQKNLSPNIHQFISEHVEYFGTYLADPPWESLSHEELDKIFEAEIKVIESAKIAVENRTPLDVVFPSEFSVLSNENNVNYMFFIQATGWRESTASHVLNVMSASQRPRWKTDIEIYLFDVAEERVLWYGRHYGNLDPENEDHIQAITAALIFELYTGRRVSAHSFTTWPENAQVLVYLYEGHSRSGILIGREGFDIILRQKNGEKELIPLSSIRLIRDWSNNRIFPSLRRSS